MKDKREGGRGERKEIGEEKGEGENERMEWGGKEMGRKERGRKR